MVGWCWDQQHAQLAGTLHCVALATSESSDFEEMTAGGQTVRGLSAERTGNGRGAVEMSGIEGDVLCHKKGLGKSVR